MRCNSPRSTLLALVFLGGVACGNDGSPQADCDAGVVPRFDQVMLLKTTCVKCHSSAVDGDARNGAPESVNYDTYEAAKKDAERGAQQVFERKMPYPGGVGATEDTRQQLYRWALCGTPAPTPTPPPP